MKQRLAFLKSVKETLLARRDEIHASLRSNAKAPSTPGDVKDSGDEASSATMSDLQSSLEATEINELKSIEDALHRMERNEYGVCVDCGEPINMKRLEIAPYVARCITCQEKLEG